MQASAAPDSEGGAAISTAGTAGGPGLPEALLSSEYWLDD